VCGGCLLGCVCLRGRSMAGYARARVAERRTPTLVPSTDVLPSRTVDDNRLYDHFRDSYRSRLDCPTTLPVLDAWVDPSANASVVAAAAVGPAGGDRQRWQRLNATLECACEREFFCACNGTAASTCVKAYFKRKQPLWSATEWS
jgi:hypothetical protein